MLIWNSVITQNLNIYFYNYQTKTAIFIATKHEKNYGSYLGFHTYFLHFEIMTSNTMKNKTRKKFKNLFRVNFVKYSSKFPFRSCKHTSKCSR